MTALPPLEIRYADIVTPDFNAIQEEQLRCDGCAKGVWPEDATEVDDERFCADCVAEMNAEFEEGVER